MSWYPVSVGYKRIGIGMKQSSRIGFGMGDIGIGEISREWVSLRKVSTHAYRYNSRDAIILKKVGVFLLKG